MADVNTQCKGCHYWLSGSGGYPGGGVKLCHHLLYTGKRRVEVDGVCLSRAAKRKRGKKT